MRALKRVTSASSAAVIMLSGLMSLGFSGVAQASAQVCTWTGITSNTMNVAGNWSSCSGSTPQAGDMIKFATAPSGGSVNLTNNLGIALGGIIDSYSAISGTYNINTLALTDGAVLSNAAQTACNTYPLNVRVTNVTSSGSITDNNGMLSDATLAIAGNLSLDYGYLSAQSGSHVDGNLTVSSPVDTYLNTCSGGLGGGGGQQSGASLTGITIHSLSVQNSAYVSLADVNYPLTLGGGTGSDAPRISFYGNLDNNYNYVATTYAVSSPITLTGDAVFYVGDQTTVNVTGAISGNHAITRDPNSSSTGTLNIQPSSNASNTVTGTITNPSTTTTISDAEPNNYVTVVDNNTTTLDGSVAEVGVNGGGILKGTGTAGSIYVNANGIIAPGHSPGTLTATNRLNLNDGAIYQAELKDKTAGDFDQIVAGQAADTTGNDVTLGNTPSTGSTLTVSLYSGYNIKAGDQFEIINNLSNTPVYSMFNGLPEGATFKVGGGVFKISYVGGDGNDVVLTAVTAPTAPDTGFALTSSHPGATLGVTVLAAGFIFAVAKTNQRKLAPARARASKRR